MKTHFSASVLLVALLLSSSMLSCGDQTTPQTQNTPVSNTVTQAVTEAETVNPYALPALDVPDKDYGGAAFTYYSNGRDSVYYSDKYIDADSIIGEPVNDAVYNRNLQVEDKFNIKIQMVDFDYMETAAAAAKLVAAQDSSIDVVNACGCMLSSYTIDGYYLNLYDLPYVNLTAEYWSPYAVSGMTVRNKLFMMPAEISMSGLANGRFIYFNKKLISDYDLTIPYTLVSENKWTLDTFLTMAKTVSADTNGDGTMNQDDVLGMLTEVQGANNNFTHFLIASGESFSSSDNDGNRYYSVNSDKAQSLLEAMSAVLDDSAYAIDYTTIGKNTGTFEDNTYWKYARSLFAQGHFLFLQSSLGCLDELRDMTDDFGIVPNPKYDESQDKYYHRFDRYGPMFAVPVSAPDPERVGLVMEYTAWLSHQTVLPAYYDVTVKQKRIRDERDVEMLDIIRQSIVYDFGDIFETGIANALAETYGKKQFASTMAKKEKSIAKTIDKMLAKIEN